MSRFLLILSCKKQLHKGLCPSVGRSVTSLKNREKLNKNLGLFVTEYVYRLVFKASFPFIVRVSFFLLLSGVLRSTMYGNDDSRPLQDGNDNFAFSEKSIRMGKEKWHG